MRERGRERERKRKREEEGEGGERERERDRERREGQPKRKGWGDTCKLVVFFRQVHFISFMIMAILGTVYIH